MIESENDLRAILDGTSLAKSQIAVLTVRETQETVFAIEPISKGLEDWSTLRSVVDQTSRWPVMTLLHSDGSDPWEERVRRADLFSRFYFKEEHRGHRKGDSPHAVLEAAEGLDVAAQFAGFTMDETVFVEEYLEIALERTQAQFGQAPQIPDPLTFLSDNRLFSPEDVERWLFEWEIANCSAALRLPEHGLAHISWFEPNSETQALLLMPSARGWEVPAYMNWFASYLCNSQFMSRCSRNGTCDMELSLWRTSERCSNSGYLVGPNRLVWTCPALVDGYGLGT